MILRGSFFQKSRCETFFNGSYLPRGAISVVIFCVTLLAIPTAAKYGGGSGTAEDPYLIYTAEQMNVLGVEPNDWDKHFRLMADIDLCSYTGTDFNIIGTGYIESPIIGLPYFVGTPFTGTFDGNGHEIMNFTYNYTGKYIVGFFGVVDGANAKIKNLGLRDVDINVVHGDRIGSLIGLLLDGMVVGCYTIGANVSGGHRVGGLVGQSASDVYMCNCYTNINVLGHAFVGGLVGENCGNISNCTSSASVTGSGSFLGGLSGANYYGRILNCYSMGSVLGANWRGGLVAENRGLIHNCFAAGNVPGTGGNVGGLIGYNSGAVVSSFWDIQTSGQGNMCGNQHVKGTGCNDANGKTTVQMQTATTFLDAGWDFVKVWGIGENQTYPYLRKYSAADVNQDGSVNFLDLTALAENWLTVIGN